MLDINLTQHSLWTFAILFASGVATSLTPCVYPIIPIVVGYLGNQTGSKREKFLRTLVYVFGMSLVYASLGLAAALTGSFFGEFTNNSTVYLLFGLLILALGGNMMDWYQLPLPQFLQPKADGQRRKLTIISAFLVGGSAGLVASPCTAPILGTILAYIASTHDVLRGTLMMFVFSLGMNMLLLVLGFSASLARGLPRSGMWMARVKKIMALLMMAGGIYFIYKAGQIS